MKKKDLEGNSLALHIPNVHNITTSKVAVIFTGRLKTGFKGHIQFAAGPKVLNRDKNNSFRLKENGLENRPSLFT